MFLGNYSYLCVVFKEDFMTLTIIIQLLIVLLLIFVGARKGGIGLGIYGMVGVFLLVFVFGLVFIIVLLVLFSAINGSTR